MEEFKQFEQNYLTFTGAMAEPKMMYFNNGGCVCSFGLALKKNKDDKATWLNCKVYNKLAEKLGEYEKGSKITVVGYFKTEKGKDGKEYLNFIVMLGD